MSVRPDPPRVGRVYTGPVVHVDRGQLNAPAPRPTDGFILDFFRGKKSEAFEAAVKVRRKSQQAFVRLTTASAVLAARTMVAGIGHPAAYAIFRSVVVEIRNRIETRLGPGVLHEHKTTVYVVQTLVATVVTLLNNDRGKFLRLFMTDSDATSVEESAAITSLFDALSESFSKPCVRIGSDKRFALIMTKEACDATIMLLDGCERLHPAWAREATRSSYPLLAYALVTLGVSEAVSSTFVDKFVDIIRQSTLYKLAMEMHPDTGIDAFVAAVGADSRDGVAVQMGETLAVIMSALRSRSSERTNKTVMFRAPDAGELQRAESFIVAEGSSTREAELEESKEEIEDDDETYWDAKDFIVPVVQDADSFDDAFYDV